MDILPEPNDATTFLTRIPYLPHYSWEPWGTEGFLAILNKHGFLDQAGKFKPQHDTSNMASMLQAWLFFGVLAETIGRAFKVQDFVKQDDLGQDFITLAPLKKRNVFCGEIRMEVEMEIQLKIIDFRPSSLAHLPHVCEVWHSIMWLYEVLGTRSFKDALQICSLQMSTRGSAFGDFDKALDPFRRRSFDRLDRTQWCPFNRRRLQSLQHCTLRYVTSIPRTSFPPFLTHRNCSENACTGNAIDVETFQTRHVDENCSCSFVGVSTSHLASLCRQGSIPLIDIRSWASRPDGLTSQEELYDSSHNIDRSVQPWTPSSRFTAISHIWSHGLGNERSNSLPRCQLIKLALAVDRASRSRKGTQLVWMDILCIPAPSTGYAAERSTSINKMGIIYAAAETVLVLDYELQRIPIKNLDRLQILAHLLTCSWMERAWTFNEGSLSRSCCIQFADEILDTEEIYEFSSGGLWGSAPRLFSRRLRYFVELDMAKHWVAELGRGEYRGRADVQIPEHFRLPGNARWDNSEFISGWNALRCRSTSQPEDLVVILANLQGINISHLSRFRPEERLAVLMSFQRFVPFTFLTSPNQSEYSCLSEPNRWIPRTIDGSYISSDYLLEQTPSDDGLKLHYKDMYEPFLRLIMLPSSLELSGERDIQICANACKTSLRVKFLRESYPPIDRNPTMKFLLVERENEFSIRQNLPLKGCCLQLPDSIHLPEEELEQSGKHCTYLNKFLSKYHKILRFTYDCPIRAEPSEDLLLLSHTDTPPVSTPCRSDEAHQIQDPCSITIASNLRKYREQAACRNVFAIYMEIMLNYWLRYNFIWTVITSYSLIFDLLFEIYSRTEADVLDYPKFFYCSGAAGAIIQGRYTWGFLPLQRHVIEILAAAQGLIGDIFIIYIILTLYKGSRETIVQTTLVRLDIVVNFQNIVYQAVLQQMIARYLLRVWLATFQDDWSSKTHNKRWWTFFGFWNGTPETAFEGPWFVEWFKRLAKSFVMLKAGFGLFGTVDDLDRNPYSWEL